MRLSTISFLMSLLRVAVLSIDKSGRQFDGGILLDAVALRKARIRRIARHCASDDFHGAFGQGVNEGLAVAFDEDAVVQDDDDAGIGLGADEAADALAELED